MSGIKIAYLTAGAGGMICGSCLHDNTLARALMQSGCDVQLIPTYTPIRTDERDVSIDRVFFGGINVYLEQKVPLFRRLPAWVDGWLSRPRLLRWVTGGRIKTNAANLADLTLSMLRGEAGFQRKEVERLVDYLAAWRPHLVNFSNVLIAGCAPALRRRLNVPLLVTLQGDDLFLDDLPPNARAEAIELIARGAASIDGFLVHSRYYADYMSDYLRLPRERFRLAPIGIDVSDFRAANAPAAGDDFRAANAPAAGDADLPRPRTIGYLARHCPAKGLHVLVEAFIRLRRMPGTEQVRLHTAGWLGESDRPYFDAQLRRIAEAGLERAYHYAGVLDRRQKVEFLSTLDVMSVPTIYRDPKGLFVLEALASGVPVVQPDHGAFPELLAETGGGVLVPPDDPGALAEALHALLMDDQRRVDLGRRGRQRVCESFGAAEMARETIAVFHRFLNILTSAPSP